MFKIITLLGTRPEIIKMSSVISKLNQTFNLLKHRGPDLENFITLDNLSIGHNLLQIRGELNSSKQPKFAKNRKYILAFNGQIYNMH